jgi:tripartite-type tricarboxylate transporter receptor subunit TctC
MISELARVLMAAAMAGAALAAQAQDFPKKPMKLVVPAGAGTTTDIVARMMGEGLSRELGQAVVVENKTGASGNIAHELVARSPADGYTLILTNTGPLSINRSLYKKINFDPVKDFIPIAMIGYTPTLMLVRADAPWKTVGELVAYARQSPGKVTYASAGNGTTGHLAAELVKAQSGTKMVHVPFKEGAQAVTSVIGGQTDFMFYHPAVAMPQIQAGKLRALGLSSKVPSPAAAGVKPLAEQGFAGFDLSGWWGLAAPANVPPAVVARLVQASERIVRSSDFVAKLHGAGIEPMPMSQPEFALFVGAELEKWGKVVQLSGAQVD